MQNQLYLRVSITAFQLEVAQKHRIDLEDQVQSLRQQLIAMEQVNFRGSMTEETEMIDSHRACSL